MRINRFSSIVPPPSEEGKSSVWPLFCGDFLYMYICHHQCQVFNISCYIFILEPAPEEEGNHSLIDFVIQLFKCFMI